jgi:glycosyltransferase involved in cell wall biosynthesis
MRVCFVAHSGKNGGAERVLLETIEIIRNAGVDCRVLLPEPGDLEEELQKLGTPYSVISYPHWMRRGPASILDRTRVALATVLNSLILAWRIRSLKCDVVYTNTVTVCVGAIAAWLNGIPHIWHLHEFGMEDQGLSFFFGERYSLGLVNRLSARCICVSRILAGKYERFIDPSKITVIYPSMHLALDRESKNINGKTVLPTRNGRFRCVIAGALMEGKGQAESVLAFAVLKKAGVNAELFILGEGLPDYRRDLEELVALNGVNEIVHFLGNVRNAMPVMREADAVLVCSKSEAFGRVTIEAMLAGRPVIGARSGATQELITDGVNGLLYTLGDPSDLAAVIKRLSEHPKVAVTLTKNARSWAQSHFSEYRYSKEILSVFRSLGTTSGMGNHQRQFE